VVLLGWPFWGGCLRLRLIVIADEPLCQDAMIASVDAALTHLTNPQETTSITEVILIAQFGPTCS
jgi:hypothetical protein